MTSKEKPLFQPLLSTKNKGATNFNIKVTPVKLSERGLNAKKTLKPSESSYLTKP